MATMFGWCRFAAASASAAKSQHLLFAGELARQDHLERHDPVQADLARLVDHAHAAAGDFLQQFVIAKAPHAKRETLFCTRAQFRGQWSSRIGGTAHRIGTENGLEPSFQQTAWAAGRPFRQFSLALIAEPFHHKNSGSRVTRPFKHTGKTLKSCMASAGAISCWAELTRE